MAASLTKLKGFIETYIDIGFENISESETNELKSFLSETLLSLRWEINTELNNMNTEAEKNRYIFSVQFQLTYLADGINSFDQKPDTSTPLSEIFEWGLNGIFELLDHIRNYFSPYFNYETDLPKQFISYHKATYNSICPILIERLEGHNIDPELAAIIRSFIEVTDGSEGFKVQTWRHWDYRLKTIEAISHFFEDSPANDTDLELLKLFVSLEFNSIQIYAYFLKYIGRTISSELNYQEQQQDLLLLLKIFQQVRIDVHYLYDPQVQSLKTSFMESLKAELNYLAQKEKLFVRSFTSTGPETPSKFYFKVAVTLAELMFLFRVMIEVTFIQTKFKSYLYEFAYNHIQTERAENMSKKSMRNHFNNRPFPDRLVRNIRNWLTKMIDHIDHHYKS